MIRKLTFALAAALCLASAARADEPGTPEVAPPAAPPVAAPSAAPEDAKPAEDAAPAPKPHRRPGGLIRGGMAMKQVVCKVVEEGKGKQGMELASAIEAMASQFARANYRLTAILQGEPPIACFHSQSDPSKLPMGAR